MSYLLDTNIVSILINKKEDPIKNIFSEIAIENDMFISAMSYYEIKRGLLAVNGFRKLDYFENICDNFTILLLDDLTIIETASSIYANLRKKGMLIQDVDILIAATALVHKL